MPQYGDIVEHITAVFASAGISVGKKTEIVFPPKKLAEVQNLLPGLLVEKKEIERRPYIRMEISAEDELTQRLYSSWSRSVPGESQMPTLYGVGREPNQLRNTTWWPWKRIDAVPFNELFGQVA
jgi:hypothetical protein